MKNSIPCPAAPASGTTIQHRLAAQCAAMLEEIRSAIPQAAQADFETPVFSALALLQLDARKHCLHQHDLLRLLYLQGVFHGAVFGLECAASRMQQERRPEAMQTKQTPHTTPERQPVPLSDSAAHA